MLRLHGKPFKVCAGPLVVPIELGHSITAARHTNLFAAPIDVHVRQSERLLRGIRIQLDCRSDEANAQVNRLLARADQQNASAPFVALDRGVVTLYGSARSTCSGIGVDDLVDKLNRVPLFLGLSR